MKPHLLHVGAGIKPPFLPNRFGTGRRRGYFFSVRQKLAERSEQTTVRSSNVVNHLHVVNQLLMRVSIVRSDAAIRRLAADQRVVSGLAGAAIDVALRRELDRQLRLMARGENIAANQRRQKLLSNYLQTKPAQELHRVFYRPVMQVLQTQPTGAMLTEDDIITERRTAPARMVELREECTPPQGNVRPEELRRIADQVFARVEKKLRLNGARTGKLR